MLSMVKFTNSFLLRVSLFTCWLLLVGGRVEDWALIATESYIRLHSIQSFLQTGPAEMATLLSALMKPTKRNFN